MTAGVLYELQLKMTGDDQTKALPMTQELAFGVAARAKAMDYGVHPSARHALIVVRGRHHSKNGSL